jgi:hypothetical protein
MPPSPNPNPGAEVLEVRPLQRAGMKADFSWTTGASSPPISIVN